MNLYSAVSRRAS